MDEVRSTGGSDTAIVIEKRGRGRPLGSTNKPKPPKLSPQQVEALKSELGPQYIDAVLMRAKAELHARGLKTLITSKLGREILGQIEADVVVVVENEKLTVAAPFDQARSIAA